MTEHTGTVERQLEKLRRDFGDVFLNALADPETVEIMLNPDGTLWQERLGGRPVQIGSMTRTKTESVLRTIAACLQTTITREKPTIECELPLDGSRFAGQIRRWFRHLHSRCAKGRAEYSPSISTSRLQF